MIMQVKNLSAGYGRRNVFEGINFSLCENELLAVLGPNGAGKTTLLKCMNSVLRPGKGAVLVGGKDVSGMSSGEIALKVAYVAQKQEPARLTVFDAILLGRKPHMGWRISEKDLQVADAAIKRLDLGNLMLKYTDSISSGELQKVSIARALVQEPSLLLLDEPTSNLDMKNQLEILQTLRAVIAEHRVGAVMTMHDLNLAMRFADRFLLLKDGRIHSSGDAGCITPGMIKDVYGVDVKITRAEGFPVILPCGKKYGGKFFENN